MNRDDINKFYEDYDKYAQNMFSDNVFSINEKKIEKIENLLQKLVSNLENKLEEVQVALDELKLEVLKYKNL